MSDPLDKRLHIVFSHAARSTDEPPRRAYRYMPSACDGGWCVFDRKLGREVYAHDLVKIPTDVLANEIHYDA